MAKETKINVRASLTEIDESTFNLPNGTFTKEYPGQITSSPPYQVFTFPYNPSDFSDRVHIEGTVVSLNSSGLLVPFDGTNAFGIVCGILETNGQMNVIISGASVNVVTALTTIKIGDLVYAGDNGDAVASGTSVIGRVIRVGQNAKTTVVDVILMMGPAASSSSGVTMAQVNTAITTALADYAKSANVYTKTEADAKFATK